MVYGLLIISCCTINIKIIEMQTKKLKITIRFNRKQDKVNDSTVANDLNCVEGEPNLSSGSTLVGSLDPTPQGPFSCSEGEDIHNIGDEESEPENAQNQMVLYDPAVANRARGVEAVPDPIGHQPPSNGNQPPSFTSFPFSNQTSRVLPSVGAFTVQCASCLKWRLIPSKDKYEEIREHIIEQPFFCETALEWRSDISCDDPPDIMQDDSRLWAIDKPSIAQPPPGWERLLRIRGEGSTKFADVYYVAPTGKRLRSIVEIQKYLDKHPEYVEEGVRISQFSFRVPKPLQENYVRKRPHAAPSCDATNQGMLASPDPSKAITWVEHDEEPSFQHGGRETSAPYPEAPILNTESQPAKKRAPSKRRFDDNLSYNQNEVTLAQSTQLSR